jgi:alcohol dehydrogenase class IV
MPKAFSMLMPSKVVAGHNAVAQMDVILKRLCRTDNVLLVSDKGVRDAGLLTRPAQILETVFNSVRIIDTIPPEPEADQVESMFKDLEGIEFSMIVAIGGGSVLDSAKLFSALMADNPTMREMTNGVTLRNRGPKTLMIPTTSGTGSEATQNAIVSVSGENRKMGIVSEHLVPDYVILDPEMTISLPPKMTAATGIDALCHAIECFYSKKANAFSDMLGIESIRLIFKSLLTAFRNPTDIQAREDMLLASYYGGMCIATSGTTAVHALSYPLGGIYHLPHGISNAILLAPVLKYNMDHIIGPLNQVAKTIPVDTTGMSKQQIAEQVVEKIEVLIRAVEIPEKLSQVGIESPDVDELVDSAAKVTRLLNNNPKSMSKADIKKVYQTIL